MDIVEVDCLEAQARERTVKRAHQAARRGSARKGKEFRCYHRAGGTGAQAVTHDALREIDLSRVDRARAGMMNGPVCFQHRPMIGTPPLVRADAQGQHMDAGSTQGARIMARIIICRHRRTSHKAKAPLAGWCDDAGVSRLRHSDCGRIIFCGYVRIRTTPRIMKVAPASRIRLAGGTGMPSRPRRSDEVVMS